MHLKTSNDITSLPEVNKKNATKLIFNRKIADGHTFDISSEQQFILDLSLLLET